MAKLGQEEFGHSKFGHQARTNRMVETTNGVEQARRGMVRQNFATEKEQHGCYRILHNDNFDHQDMLDSTALAGFKRLSGEMEACIVPIDLSSLKLKDKGKRRDVGVVGNAGSRGRGLKVGTALILSPVGETMGVLAQRYWKCFPKKKTRKRVVARRKKKLEEKETWYWWKLVQDVIERHRAADVAFPLWFQMDREGDAHELLNEAADYEGEGYFTIRMAQNRLTDCDTPLGRAFVQLAMLNPVLECTIEIPRTGNTKARIAHVQIRFCKQRIALRNAHQKKAYRHHEYYTVEVREVGGDTKNPLCWRLLTTYPIHSIRDLWSVVHAYRLRWRIEDFHRAWKHDGQVEKNRLIEFEPIVRWSIIHAVVAVRAERIKHLSRDSPNEDASIEFSDAELKAIIILRHGKGFTPPDTITLETATLWLAQLAGYTYKSAANARPPGQTIIARGLQRIEPLVTAIEAGFDILPATSG